MGNFLKTTYFIGLSANSVTIPEGFTSAVLTNDGTAAMTLTNDIGQTYSLAAGETLRWDLRSGLGYAAVIIDSTSTTGRLTYIL